MHCRYAVLMDMDPMLGSVPQWVISQLDSFMASTLSGGLVTLAKYAGKNPAKIADCVRMGPLVNVNGAEVYLPIDEDGGVPAVDVVVDQEGELVKRLKQWAPSFVLGMLSGLAIAYLMQSPALGGRAE